MQIYIYNVIFLDPASNSSVKRSELKFSSSSLSSCPSSRASYSSKVSSSYSVYVLFPPDCDFSMVNMNATFCITVTLLLFGAFVKKNFDFVQADSIFCLYLHFKTDITVIVFPCSFDFSVHRIFPNSILSLFAGFFKFFKFHLLFIMSKISFIAHSFLGIVSLYPKIFPACMQLQLDPV